MRHDTARRKVRPVGRALHAVPGRRHRIDLRAHGGARRLVPRRWLRQRHAVRHDGRGRVHRHGHGREKMLGAPAAHGIAHGPDCRPASRPPPQYEERSRRRASRSTPAARPCCSRRPSTSRAYRDDGLFAWFAQLFHARRPGIRDVILYHIPSVTAVEHLARADPPAAGGLPRRGDWRQGLLRQRRQYRRRCWTEHGDLAILVGDERQLAAGDAQGRAGLDLRHGELRAEPAAAP